MPLPVGDDNLGVPRVVSEEADVISLVSIQLYTMEINTDNIFFLQGGTPGLCVV